MIAHIRRFAKRALGVSDSYRVTDAKGVATNHEVDRTLHEDYIVPAHEPRVASPLYTQTHHDMVYVRDSACFICGVRNSTLKDPSKNVRGSKDMETHHWIIEWSLANAVDYEKVKPLVPDFDWSPVKADDPSTFFHFIDSEANMMVLCDQCHRGKHGIHSITYPIWNVQRFLKDGFALFPA